MSKGKIEWVPYVEKPSRVVRGAHSFTKRILHWPYCARCGLLLLKNDATRRAAKAECVTIEDA